LHSDCVPRSTDPENVKQPHGTTIQNDKTGFLFCALLALAVNWTHVMYM